MSFIMSRFVNSLENRKNSLFEDYDIHFEIEFSIDISISYLKK